MNQGWMCELASTDSDGPPLANTTTQGSIIPTDAVITLPPGFCRKGSKFYVTACGRISNIVTTPGTLLFQLLFGAAGVWSPAAFNLNTTAKTNVSWWLEAMFSVRTIGSGTTATIMGQGTFSSEAVVGAAAGVPITLMLPASAPAVGTGFDSTASQKVDLQAKWSIANAGNTMTLHQYSLESRN